jgi:hypothetical protein
MGQNGNLEIDGQPVAVTTAFESMVTHDLECVRSFLVKKNNDGKINLNLLCVVALEEMCTVASEWAGRDWSRPQSTAIEKGRDVKALVLISPHWRCQRAVMDPRNDQVRRRLSVLIMCGKDQETARLDAARLYSRFERSRPEPPESADERRKVQDLFFVMLPTSRQGVELLNSQEFDVGKKNIGGFIILRLVNQRANPDWAWRRK